MGIVGDEEVYGTIEEQNEEVLDEKIELLVD